MCEQVVRKCNEGARTMERTEMMYTINSQLEFKIKVWTPQPGQQADKYRLILCLWILYTSHTHVYTH